MVGAVDVRSLPCSSSVRGKSSKAWVDGPQTEPCRLGSRHPDHAAGRGRGLWMRPRRFLAQEARLTISPAMAYGHEGVGGHRNCRKGSAELPPKIPPDATLIFDVDFVSFECKDCGKNATGLHRKSLEFKSWAGFQDSGICIYICGCRACMLAHDNVYIYCDNSYDATYDVCVSLLCELSGSSQLCTEARKHA